MSTAAPGSTAADLRGQGRACGSLVDDSFLKGKENRVHMTINAIQFSLS